MSAAAGDLNQALERMSFEVLPGRFALIGVAAEPRADELQLLGEGPAQLIREGGETTWLLAEDAADELLRSHPTAQVERGLVWIRFIAPMNWEVVGFLAKVTGSLASAGVPTARYQAFSSSHAALKHLDTVSLPVVIKACGAAQGKGVAVCSHRDR